MKNAYDVIVRPLITEKNVKNVDASNKFKKYTFEVMQGVNRIEVKEAVEKIFKVTVKEVNMINVRPRRRKVGKYEGLRPAVCKAIVTLNEGQTLDVYEI